MQTCCPSVSWWCDPDVAMGPNPTGDPRFPNCTAGHRHSHTCSHRSLVAARIPTMPRYAPPSASCALPTPPPPRGHHVIRPPRLRVSMATESQTHAKPNSKGPPTAALDMAGGRTPVSLGVHRPSCLCLNETNRLKQVTLSSPGLQIAPEGLSPSEMAHTLDYISARAVLIF